MMLISKETMAEAIPTWNEGYDSLSYIAPDWLTKLPLPLSEFVENNPYPRGSKQWRRWNYGKKGALSDFRRHWNGLVSGAVRDVKYMTMH